MKPLALITTLAAMAISSAASAQFSDGLWVVRSPQSVTPIITSPVGK